MNARTSQAWEAQTECPYCHASSGVVISTRDGKTGDELITVSCDGCGLGRIDPLPSEKALEDWYKTQYRQAYKGQVNPSLKYVLRAARNAMDRFQWMSAMLQGRPGWEPAQDARRSLDIGASSGEFVALMKKAGFQALGIEPHEGYAEYARQELGLQVIPGSMNDQLRNIPRRSIGIASMFHVLEHLVDPVRWLREIGACLTEEGLLFIEVPSATKMGSPHYMFFRAHTLYFTQASLARLLEKAGYEVVARNDDSSGNLRVMARYLDRPAPAAAVPHTHPLVQAQQARQWLPYLLTQLKAGEPVRKIRVRQEEKATASRYRSGRELLDALYSGVGPVSGAGPRA